jgi:hypothetical protein
MEIRRSASYPTGRMPELLRNSCACEGKRRFRGVLFFLQINYEFGFSKARSIKVFSITPVTGTIITNQAKYNAVAT